MRRRTFGRGLAGLAVGGLAAARAQGPGDAPGAGRVAPGTYVEVGDDGRPNWEFTLVAELITPNIVQLRGRHGWVAFGAFEAARGEYRGAFEFARVNGQGPGGKWADLYDVRVSARGGVLKVEGKSAANTILIRARPAADVPPPAGGPPRPRNDA